MTDSLFRLTPGGVATLACTLEVSAPKPGNVHRGADFEDVTFTDFAVSAVVLGQVIDQFSQASVGETILQAVKETAGAVGTNTNLGMILLIVPLAKLAHHQSEGLTFKLTKASVDEYLKSIHPTDGQKVFEAIRLAKPGGLGDASDLDVQTNVDVDVDLLKAMKLSADRDAIARQYSNGFADVIETGVGLICDGKAIFGDLSKAIVYAQVAWMAKEPDSLIARKCGIETAEKSQILASKAMEEIESHELFWSAVGELDFWLRSDGHRRNPGTTADLIAASLFVAINNGNLEPPFD